MNPILTTMKDTTLPKVANPPIFAPPSPDDPVPTPVFDQVVVDVVVGETVLDEIPAKDATLERLAVIGVMPPSQVARFEMILDKPIIVAEGEASDGQS